MPTDIITATGTWQAPAGVTEVFVKCWAGGGGGGVGASGEGGGSGSGYSEATFAVIPLTTYDVTVGTGGAPGASGTESLFDLGFEVIASGGVNASAATGGPAPGAGIGDVTTVGGAGGNGSVGAGFRAGGGGGAAGNPSGNGAAGTAGVVDVPGVGGTGANGGGSGGNGGADSMAGSNGVIPGGGAGGGGKNANAGTGARGEIHITYTVSVTVRSWGLFLGDE